ncbi:MAG: holo-ACP synthase [Simkaniaceae bacterium]|nr:holo-ACP synthase [Simkaniaceae bacterium]
MIGGIGTDIVEVEKIRQAIERRPEKFYDQVFTQEEVTYCLRYHNPFPSFAGRFAAKEAIVKALGTGFVRGVGFRDIAITNDEEGRPYPLFSDALLSRFETPSVFLSISHCHKYAVAFALRIDENPRTPALTPSLPPS